MKLKDSGKRKLFKSGALIDPGIDKGRFDLIPPEPMFRLAKIYEAGAKKYAPNNWKRGIPWSRCVDSLERHWYKYKRGDKDEDHLAIVAWRAFALMYYEVHHKELCDIDELK